MAIYGSWNRVCLWCNGRLKRHSLGLTAFLTLVICVLCVELWRSNQRIGSTNFQVHLREVQQIQCPPSKSKSRNWNANEIVISSHNIKGNLEADEIHQSKEDKMSEWNANEIQDDFFMKQRRDAVSLACTNIPPETISRSVKHAMAAREHKFLYCPVEKSASTFWRRFMYQLVLTHPMQSPFDVSVQTVYSPRFPTAQVKITETGDVLDSMLRSFTKMLFIREPYSRLLSAYVDKLLAPNPVMWSNWGLPCLSLCQDSSSKLWCKDRSGYSRHPQKVFPAGKIDLSNRVASSKKLQHTTCGEDVTFPEFVKFATESLAKKDPHVMPIYSMCSPCHINYTIIGHMETFDKDVRLLLPQINITESQVNLEKMDANVAYDAIEDSVYDSMSKNWLSKSLLCITKLEVVQRIWRKLQIRGFVSWRLNPSDFKLNDESVLHMNGSSLIKVFVSANLKSSNKAELKLQKKQALKEAYSLLQPGQFQEILEVFGPDFKLFGFKQRPKIFDDFSKEDFIYTGALDFTKNWNMEPVL